MGHCAQERREAQRAPARTVPLDPIPPADVDAAIDEHGPRLYRLAHRPNVDPLLVWRALFDARLAQMEDDGAVVRYARFDLSRCTAVEIPRPNRARWLRIDLGRGCRLVLPRAVVVWDETQGWTNTTTIEHANGIYDDCHPDNLREVQPRPSHPAQLAFPFQAWRHGRRILRRRYGVIA